MPRAIPSRSRDASLATSRVESSRRASRAASARVTATASALDASEDRNNASAPNRARSSITTGSPSASYSTPRTCARDATGNVAVVAAVPAPVATARAPLAAVSETAVAPAASDETRRFARADVSLPRSTTNVAWFERRRGRDAPEEWYAWVTPAPTAAAPAAAAAGWMPHRPDMVLRGARLRSWPRASRERVQTSQKIQASRQNGTAKQKRRRGSFEGARSRRQEKRRTRSTFPWRRRARAPPRGASRESLSSRKPPRPRARLLRAPPHTETRVDSVGTRRVVAKVDSVARAVAPFVPSRRPLRASATSRVPAP